jgi:dynein heavy chain
VKLILSSMFLEHFSFPAAVQAVGTKVPDAAVAIQKEIAKNFMPTAIRFHYNFNLRDLYQVLQALFRTSPTVIRNTALMVRLLGTEAVRVYADCLNDCQKAKDLCITGTIKHFEGVMDSQVIRDEQMFCAFAPDGDEANFE